MYKVLFAEDEILVRLGLQNAIPWERFGMELVALADNGLAAYDLYRKWQPHLVITDINMEGLTGFELIKKIRAVDKTCCIMVITCVDDFQMLRDMVVYDIAGYILKSSMDMEEIFQVLERIQERLGYSYALPAEKASPILTAESPKKHVKTEMEPEDFSSLLLLYREAVAEATVNELADTFILEIIHKQFPGHYVEALGGNGYCIALDNKVDNVKERIKRINFLMDSLLGLTFQAREEIRRDGEGYQETVERLLDTSLHHGGNVQSIIIKKAMDYISLHYQEPMGLSELAQAIGVSSSYLSRLFHRETGKKYIDYLNEIRMDYALEDLLNSDVKVAVIAEQNGFPNVEHFTRTFKKYFGLSPARWREEHR